MNKLRHIIKAVISSCFVLFCSTVQAAKPPAYAVASATSYATDAGMKILSEGGNAFDAAVTIASVLAVTEPYHSGLGGGGFWLIYDARRSQYMLIDGREIAPGKATATMYLNEKGEVIKNASVEGALSAAIPGEPAALVHLAQTYGTMPLSKTLAPAIKWAENGFPVDEHYRGATEYMLEHLRAFPASTKTFLKDNDVPPIGYLIKQSALANTLRGLAEHGTAGFYQGAVAKQLVQGVDENGGIWTLKDLLDYRLIFRKPLIKTIDDLTIVTTPLPSAGGVALVAMLNILNNFPFSSLVPMTQMQVTIEAMRRAYWDRRSFLGDPAFVDMPLAKLLSTQHAKDLANSIVLERATPSDTLTRTPAQKKAAHHTTHYSVIDQAGNMVAATLSTNHLFGSGFMPEGTGVLLNNEMDDFSIDPTTNPANAIEACKRPLSSMMPTFLLKKDSVAIFGVPGGKRIPTMMLLATLDFLKGHAAESMVNVKRYHHQYLPDVVEYEENGLTDLQKARLEQMGYQLRMVERRYGDMQVVLWDKKANKVYAASDPRQQGKASVVETD